MAGSALLLLGCVAGSVGPTDEGLTCDPRTLAAGEVRAKQIGCGDELIGGGEGHSGDWLIENAVARFVVRGTYAALTELDEAGGTVIDAAAPAGPDLLLEYRPGGDRSTIEAVDGDGWAELRLPGVTYHLDADVAALEVSSATGRLIGVPGVTRTGPTLRDEDAFLGLDGAVVEAGGAATLDGVTRLALSPEALWTDGAEISGEVDADEVVAFAGLSDVARVPVVDGAYDAWLPAGVALLGQRDGCDYDGLSKVACGDVQVRVADGDGEDLRASLTDGTDTWDVPTGGGRIAVGATPRPMWLWAGPAYSAARFEYDGGDEAVGYTLAREMPAEGAVWAAFGDVVAPDADVTVSAEDVAHALVGEGVAYAVVIADDEVPQADADAHDDVIVRAGSRADGWLWSWPWSANEKRPAHGAVPWQGFGALDQLALSEGGASTGRRMVVTPAWVEAARAEADPHLWDPKPDLLWLDSLDDLPTFLALLDDWIAVAPIASRAWVEVDGALNTPGVEGGLIDGRTTAGTGPRLDVSLRRGIVDDVVLVDVTVEASRWMHLHALSLWTPAGEQRVAIDGAGTTTFAVRADTPWVVPVVTGDHARPWSDEPAWAVGGATWIATP